MVAGRPVRVLNVAEKPSVAKEVSRILSRGQAGKRAGRSPYNVNWEFPYMINNQPCDMVFTSVTGHLMELEFGADFKKWHSCNPGELFEAPVFKTVPKDKAPIELNLQVESRQAQWLVLWLDCDREGENIAFEVIDVCIKANPRLVVKRARFSALIERDLQRAISNLVQPNRNDSEAVDARQEIDLRVGASFTRFQTLLLQKKFEWSQAQEDLENPILSYGPCQFPTLGLIVERAWEIKAHVPEDYWSIHMAYTSKEGPEPGEKIQKPRSCRFDWSRHRLFDKHSAVLLYEACVEDPDAVVTKVIGRQVTKDRPAPLNTLDMQKRVSRYLKISGEQAMHLAEELYQAGYLSYPRTETDQFDPGYNLQALCAEHVTNEDYGHHAQAVVDGSMWCIPKAGGHDDKAHPPIHPTKGVSGEEQGWSRDKLRLYQFVVRHFLACCSKPALGQQTAVEADIAGEGFTTRGLMVTERNWLLVYPWVFWGGNESLPVFQEGQVFMPTELLLKEETTRPPPYLTEGDLISGMERHGIGTDATVASHIQKQLERRYACKNEDQRFLPTKLGEALVSAYQKMDLDGLWRPDLRGRIEQGIQRVADGNTQKTAVLQEACQLFRQDYLAASRQASVIEAEVGLFFRRAEGTDGLRQGDSFGAICPKCQTGQLQLRIEPSLAVVCSSHPVCRHQVCFPRAVLSVAVSQSTCQRAACEQASLLEFRFKRAQIPPQYDPNMTACILCDDRLSRLLSDIGAGPHGTRAPLPHAGGPARGGAEPARGQGHSGGPSQRGRGRGRAPPAAPAAGRASGREATRGRARGGRAAAPPHSTRGNRAASASLTSCPQCGDELATRTSRSAANPDRDFYRCEQCQSFAGWVDEVQAGGASATADGGRGRGRGRAPGARAARGGRRGGREAPGAGRQAASRGRGGRSNPAPVIGTVTGATYSNTGDCFKCGQPGHWASNCPG